MEETFVGRSSTAQGRRNETDSKSHGKARYQGNAVCDDLRLFEILQKAWAGTVELRTKSRKADSYSMLCQGGLISLDIQTADFLT